MRNHYVPQAHLLRFNMPSKNDSVWVYDKKQRKFFSSTVRDTGHEHGFYDDAIESGLANTIEGPVQVPLGKLINRQSIDNTERTRISLYFLTMATRGPRFRRLLLESIAPAAIAKTLDATKQQIKQFATCSKNGQNAVSRLSELEGVREKFAKHLPPEIELMIRTPYFSDETLMAVHNMVWRIMPVSSGMFLVTSDTPAHISEFAGVGTAESEFTFPISKDLCLIGSHTGKPCSVEYLPAQPHIIDEVNRRIIGSAERFIYSHVKEDWIGSLAVNPQPINRINWL